MEEMLKKTVNIITLFNFRKKEEINQYMCNFFYLTQSEIREIFQILQDMDSLESENLEEKIKKFEIDINLNAKKRGESFLEYMRKIRYPVIYESKKKAEERAVKIKSQNIKLSYPENFEGVGIKIEITISNVKDVKRVLERLNRAEKDIEELIEIVKNGG
jgi:hypothetical protein